MNPYKENEIVSGLPFPVDIFIQDNLRKTIEARAHWHDCIEILYMLEGTAQQQVNDKFFSVGKDDIIILHQGDIHSTFCTPGENVRILVVKFLPDILGGSFLKLFESKYILAFLNSGSHKVNYIHHASEFSTRFYNVLMGLYEEYTSKEAAFEIFIKGYIYQLIACLIRSNIVKAGGQLVDGSDLYRLNGLFKYTETHYTEKISLEKAAGLLNLSSAYFSRNFKKVTGRTFKQYIDYVRICEAEKLLLSKNINISQAAYEVGFSDIASFNRVFKRVRGYTPGDIKRSKTAKK